MVRIVRTEEEEEQLAASDENEMLADFPRPSSPWEYSVAGCAEYMGYEAYFSQNNPKTSDPYYHVHSPPPIPPLWDFRDTHIPKPPQLHPQFFLKNPKRGSPDAHGYRHSHSHRPRVTISVFGEAVVFHVPVMSDMVDWPDCNLAVSITWDDLAYGSVDSYSCFTMFLSPDKRIYPHLFIDLTEATHRLLLLFKTESAMATNEGYLSLDKYPGGLLFSEKNLKSSGSVSYYQPSPCKGKICFLLKCRGKTILVYVSAWMSTKEWVALSVRVDPCNMWISETKNRMKLVAKCGRARKIFASEDVPIHFAADIVAHPGTASRLMRMLRQFVDPPFFPYGGKRMILPFDALEDIQIDYLRVFNQTSPNTSLLPVSSASTSQIPNLNRCNQQSSLRSMSKFTEQSRSSVFLDNSQVSFMHERPMQHMPESVQEDSLLCPPLSEQLTTDTVLHMNHSFPPESTRHEKVASRGTEKIDNIPKCDSFQSAVEGEAMNIDEGDFSSASQNVDAIGISLKKNKGKISRSIELEDLRRYYGKTTREEAAKSLGVSVSTVKRVCREHGIARWPYRKSNKIEYSPSELQGAKTGASAQSSLTMPFRDALPSKPLVQAPVQYFQSDAPSFNPPPRQLSTVTAAQTSPPVTIKATYDGTNTIVKFDLPSSATMDDLEGEVAKRLKLNVGSFTIKYQDQDGDWISLTCGDDLQYCIRTPRTLATIWMLVQSTTSGH